MNATLHRTKLLFLIILIFGFTRASAQVREPWEIGLGVGYTNYYGDLSPYKINGLRNLYRIVDFNRYYQDRPSFSLSLHHKLTPTLGFMLQANYLQFGMSDRYRNKSGNIDSTAGNYSRALNFQTSVKDIGLAFTFNANNGKVFAKNAFFYPSFYLGAGVSQFTVKGDLYDANNLPYNYRLAGNINDGSYETNLRDLRTETDSKYPDIVPYVDLGLALNFRFSRRFSLAVQSDIKYSASDYLDDVSMTYNTTYTNPAEAYAARPGYNVVDPVTRARGDNNGMNDFYINNRIVLHVGIGGKPKPAPFMAPVIYTLAPPMRQKKLVVDSVRIKAVADSMLKVNADSMMKNRVDSVKILQDSIIAATSAMRVNDSFTRVQLTNINSELKDIKSTLESQRSEPKRNRLQMSADSIKTLRQKISAQKKQSQEDALRLRIYDFQLDSLTRENEKIRKTEGTELPMDTVDMNSAPVPETKEIREYGQEVSSLKKDDRYTTDTVFRNNVNVLQTRLERFREQAKKEAAEEKTRGKNNAQKVDSLQSRINYLESVTNTQRETGQGIQTVDTVFASGKAPEVVKKDKVVVRPRYEPVIEDTIAVKKKWYQRLFGTGKKETEVEDKKVSEDTAAVKRKWYQKLFSTGPRNKEVVEKKSERDTVVESSPSVKEQKSLPDTVTRKRRWYQRLFSNKPEDTLKRSSTATPVRQNDYSVQNERPRSVKKDTVETKKETIINEPLRSADTAVKRSFAQPSKNDQTSAVADSKMTGDTIELKRLVKESDEARNRNDKVENQLRQQLKRSNDSATFYRNALVEASQINETNPQDNTKKRSIFSSRRKQEEQAQRREADNQALRDQYLSQQRYQINQTNQLQKRIDDLTTDNRNLSRSQDSYNAEIRRRRVVDLGTTTAVVAASALSTSHSLEMRSMKDELDRLKSQVNNQDKRLKVVDSLAARENKQTATVAATNPVIIVDPGVAANTTQVTALHSEIDLLKDEITRLKAASTKVAKVLPIETAAPNLRSFPVVSVYFNTGSITLSSAQAAKLTPFAQAASTNKKVAILLKGFADATGNLAVNKKLALQRMESVKNILLSKYQVSLYRISTDEPEIASGTGSKKSNPLDRRVDLVFQ